MLFKKKIYFFSGLSNLFLAKKIALILNIKLKKIEISKFSDGEINIKINDNIRNKNIFILQSLSYPINDNLLELLIIIDAIKRSGGNKIIIIIPYFGYSRQDRKTCIFRHAISAKIIVNILEKLNINKILTLDLHNDQLQGFFNISIDNIYTSLIIINNIKKYYNKNYMIISPDIGSISRNKYISKKLNLNLIIINKKRPNINKSEVINIIGKIKKKYKSIIIDDIIDTANTIVKSAYFLKEKGSNIVIAYCTHAILSGNSINNINNSLIDKIIVINTINIFKKLFLIKKINILTCANLLADCIKRILLGYSITSLYL